MSREIKEMEEGDYVKDLDGKFHRIKDVWGISKYGRLAKPSWGGFFVELENGSVITMWEARAYYKAGDPEVKEFLGESNASVRTQ